MSRRRALRRVRYLCLWRRRRPVLPTSVSVQKSCGKRELDISLSSDQFWWPAHHPVRVQEPRHLHRRRHHHRGGQDNHRVGLHLVPKKHCLLKPIPDTTYGSPLIFCLARRSRCELPGSPAPRSFASPNPLSAAHIDSCFTRLDGRRMLGGKERSAGRGCSSRWTASACTSGSLRRGGVLGTGRWVLPEYMSDAVLTSRLGGPVHRREHQ